jgi:hypothetical protein
MASILSWTRLFSSNSLKATIVEDGEKSSHEKVFYTKGSMRDKEALIAYNLNS